MDKAACPEQGRGSVGGALAGLAVGVLWAAVFLGFPVVFVLQGTWILWPLGWVHAVRWVLVAVTVLLALGAGSLARRAERDTRLAPDWRRRLHILRPLSWLPLGAVVSLCADRLPAAAVSNGIFFWPLAVVATVIARALGRAPGTFPDRAATRRGAWGILAGTTVFFLSVGWYVSSTIGEHVGDEGHYLIQARSLFQDGDLDIRNNFAADGVNVAAVDQASIHIAPNCREGRWYSWHSFGLPLLLAPFWPGGMTLRQLLLGLISGAVCAGLVLLSLRMGATLRSAVVVVLFLAASVYWTLYSVRFLPETLGASLLVWVFWAMAARKDRPWLSLWVAAAGCIYLPFAHLRFLPLSLMGFGLYGLHGLADLRSAGTWRRQLARLGVFTVVCLAGLAVYVAVHRRMFSGGASYPVGDVLFSYPLGAWAILADGRGVMAVLPLFLWLAAAWAAWSITDREHRGMALGIGATFLAGLLTSSTNVSYVGGSSVPGRYALAMVPLLVPAAARMLDRACPSARWWFVFLGLISVAVLGVLLVGLPTIGRSFTLPVPAISVLPRLGSLFNPHSVFAYDQAWTFWPTSIYGLAGLGGTLAVLLLSPGRRGLAVLILGGICVLGAAGHWALAQRPRKPYDAGTVATELMKWDLDRALVLRRDAAEPVPLLEVSRYVFRDARNPLRRPSVTTQDLGGRRVGRLLSQPRVEANDWAGRGHRWTTLTAPFPPRRGRMLIHLAGRLEGTLTVVIAIREGDRTLFEGACPVSSGRVETNIDVVCRGRSGLLYLLARLEQGEGVFRLDELYWSPCSDRLLETARLTLPADRIRAE